MPVLTPEDHAFFKENGYVVVHNAVPQENLDAVIEAIWEFLGMDPHDPEDWYREPHLKHGMVELYQHQSMWNTRQYPRLHQIFTEIFNTHKLWVSLDRVCMKPPRHPDHPEYDNKGFMHWDLDIKQASVPFWVQGVLYLTDTDADQGGFQCIPGIHRIMEEWLKTPPSERDPAVADLSRYTAVPIPGKAGDLLIWDRLLAHGNGHNVSHRPRLAQYISMYPARLETDWYGTEEIPHKDLEAQRQARIRSWQERLKAPGFPGDPREWEHHYGKTAELTPLGRKLLGLDPWED